MHKSSDFLTSTKNFLLSEEVISAIMNIVFIATFIGIFFFTYGKYIEEKIVQDQVKFLVDELSGNIHNILPQSTKDSIKNKLNNIDTNTFKHLDKEVEDNNKKLLKLATFVLTTLFIITMSFCYSICRSRYYDFGEMVKSNLTILFFIALTEFIFLTFVAQSFRSADPNFVKYSILTNIKKFSH